MREINWELIFAGIIIIIGFTIIIYSIIDSEIEQDKCKKFKGTCKYYECLADKEMWISNFPEVNLIFVGIFEEAKEIVENICLTESPIEESFLFECLKQEVKGIKSQKVIGHYRTDFAIEDKKLVIELDGHESHKTKMQRTKDAQRERYLKKEGWELIRFTGNEIYYDVVRCVQELQEFISNLKKEEVKEDDTKTIK